MYDSGEFQILSLVSNDLKLVSITLNGPTI